ncbi:glycosyltransferase [Robiginitalea aurantiaca]|uniref:Glycosyltransferase n=1 Tax=Robiginitalea aurantiaca TaxID=3056915 RepID=A0ABT7WDZ8_9FLAO|nr:glycosyltransferase [Robiginitalea aurantiaca]MDM9631142.1 glycosyltransferase [Robiginitalea aurantiaca]
MKKPEVTTIITLPIAGIENPYQFLMMQGLRLAGYNVKHGVSGKFFGLLKTTLKYRPDYLHLDWLHSYYLRRETWMTWVQFPFFVLQIYIITNIFRIKLVWTLHNIFPHESPIHGPYKWARRYFAANCQWIRVFDNSTIPRASRALNVPKDKFRVVPEGSYVDYYPNNVTQDEARHQLNLPLDKRIFLYLGLIKPYKGVLKLLEAFRESCLTNTILVIAGKSLDSQYFKLIQKSSEKSCVLIKEEFVSDHDLQYYFNASDIVALPFNKIENSGSAILAMGFSKPIIAPRKGVLASRLSQQKQLLFEEGELTKIFYESSLLNCDQLKKIGEKNFEELKKYKWEDFANCFD